MNFNCSLQNTSRLDQLVSWSAAVGMILTSRLMSSVIGKIMHKIGLLGHPMGASGAIYALYLKFLKETLYQSFIERMSVLLVKHRISISEPPFLGGLGVTYAIHH